MTDANRPKVPSLTLTARLIHAAGVVGVLALAGIGYALGYAPSARAQQQAEMKLKAIGKANDEAQATETHLDTARAELAALREEVVTLAGSDMNLVHAVTDAATARALAVHAVLAGEPAPAGGLMRNTIALHVSGSFSDITRFLADLPASLPGMAVDSFSIMPDPMAEGSLSLQASLSAYAPQAAPPGASAPHSPAGAPAATPPVR